MGGLTGSVIGAGIGGLGALSRGQPLLQGMCGGLKEGAKYGAGTGVGLATIPASYENFGEWADIPATIGGLGSGIIALRGVQQAFNASKPENDPRYLAAMRINQASKYGMMPANYTY